MSSEERVPTSEGGDKHHQVVHATRYEEDGLKHVSPEHAPKHKRYELLTDIHGDLVSARASLEESGIIDSKDEWKKGVHDTHVVVTGDSANRDGKDWSVLEFFKRLQANARDGNKVTILLGNHELDYLKWVAHGADRSLSHKEETLFRGSRLVYKKGPVLFLHGFPTLELVTELAAQYVNCGGDVPNKEWNPNIEFERSLEDFVKDPSTYRKHFEEVCARAGVLVASRHVLEETYYRAHGATIASALKSMGITTVVHGHRKLVSGGQAIEDYLPGICMINNDVAVSSHENHHHVHRVGAIGLEVREGVVEAKCVYQKNIEHHSHQKTTQVTVD